MKVVHLLPALEQGGVETVVCDLNRVLVGAGCESVVCSCGGRLTDRIVRDGGRHIALNLKSKNPLTYFSRALKLRKVLHDEKPDLVCVHSRVPAWLFIWANRALGLRWISYAHGANSVSRYSEVMTKGDLVVVPSKFLADFLKANYGITDEKIRVIPNSVDTARFNPDKLDPAFIAEKRRAWGVVPGDHVLMAIGRITPVKGLEGLIREFTRSVAEGSDSTACSPKLVIVGGADKHHLKYLESLEKLAEGKSVVFAGPQEKIPECISIADEVVSGNTTKPETFGLSIVEAYAMNKPVRAKRFGGAAEVMDAVERSGASSLREAVLSLYAPCRQLERTLSVYREVCRCGCA